MRPSQLLVPGFLLLSASPLMAQGDPADVETLDGIVRAFYEVVSGPPGEPSERTRDEYIHHPSALIGIPMVGDDGRPTIRTMTLAEYHDLFGGTSAPGFYEWEIHRDVHQFGAITHVWSTYVSSREPGGDAFDRGINSIELFFDGARWWILSWSFDRERPERPIPDEYLPG